MDIAKIMSDAIADAWSNEVPMEPGCATPEDRLAGLSRDERFVLSCSQRALEDFWLTLRSELRSQGVSLD